jgi:hypothetical protein
MIPALAVVALVWLFLPSWMAWLLLFVAVWLITFLAQGPDDARSRR